MACLPRIEANSKHSGKGSSVPESTRRLWKACGSISWFSILFWQRPFGGLDGIALLGFKYMSTNQLYNSLQINIASKVSPLKLGNY
jgi:hypothetical protein